MGKTSKFVLGHCDTHAPRYIVTCGGRDSLSWHMTKGSAEKMARELRDHWGGSGIFPIITIMKTEVIFQKEVDMEF